jgi:uncharacterized protein (TIGR02246 family)
MTNRAIADEHEIRNLVHRYADAASRRDPVGVASTFTTDGEWQAPELGRRKGRDAMIAFFTSMLDGWNVFLQGLQSGVVVLDAANADHATGRWFVQETGQRAEGSNLIISGCTTTSTGATPECGSSCAVATTGCGEAPTAR